MFLTKKKKGSKCSNQREKSLKGKNNPSRNTKTVAPKLVRYARYVPAAWIVLEFATEVL